MPTSSEVVPNTPLSGIELKELISQDFAHLLAEDGMLADYMAFGRCAYRITLELQLDNPTYPKSTTETHSRHYPLKPLSTKASVLEGKVQRKVTSPNAERLRSGQPVPVQRKQQDGTTITEKVTYPKDERIGEGDTQIGVQEIKE